jgi:hypothetical protein
MNYPSVKLEAHHLTRNSYVLGLVNGRMMIGVSFERGTWRPARLARWGDDTYFKKAYK